jgi:hypothetical protein
MQSAENYYIHSLLVTDMMKKCNPLRLDTSCMVILLPEPQGNVAWCFACLYAADGRLLLHNGLPLPCLHLNSYGTCSPSLGNLDELTFHLEYEPAAY